METFDFKPPKIEHITDTFITPKTTKLPKPIFRRKGERTLTGGDKKKEKENAKHKCQRCRKTFNARYLIIHHKIPISNYKSKGLDLPYLEFYNKRKKKAHYDRSKNLMVLCLICHKKVHDEESEKRKAKNKRKKPKSMLGDFKLPKGLK